MRIIFGVYKNIYDISVVTGSAFNNNLVTCVVIGGSLRARSHVQAVDADRAKYGQRPGR